MWSTPDSVVNASEGFAGLIAESRPVDARIVELVVDEMKNGRVKAIGSELIDVKLKFGADVLRKLVKGNFMWLKGLDWRVIHGAGNSDAQQLDQPGEEDEGRGAAPPIFSKG